MEVCSVAELQLKGHKGEILFFFFLKLLLIYCSSFLGMMCADPAVAGGGESLINKYYYLNYLEPGNKQGTISLRKGSHVRHDPDSLLVRKQGHAVKL